MTAILGLSVHRWVPIRIVKDDGISAGKVHADTTGTCRQDETKYSAIAIEAFHQHLHTASIQVNNQMKCNSIKMIVY